MPHDSRLVLAACCLAMLAVGENSTAIMAALPAMTRSLGFDVVDGARSRHRSAIE
jgi:hypothetical protein